MYINMLMRIQYNLLESLLLYLLYSIDNTLMCTYNNHTLLINYIVPTQILVQYFSSRFQSPFKKLFIIYRMDYFLLIFLLCVTIHV